jgi:glutathione synthase/RimK-type ligase-like ATP-grasp enzyme
MSSYITENRALIQAVREASAKLGIQHKLFSDDWIIQLQKNGTKRFIFAYGFDCNNQASSSIASDKVATYQLLEDASVPVIPHYLLKSVVMPEINKDLLEQLVSQYKSVVVKPLQGSRGAGVGKFEDAKDAIHFMEQVEDVWACSPFVKIEREIRVVVFGDSVHLAYEKLEPQTINGLKMFNLNLGAKSKALDVQELSDDIQKIAVDSMQSIGLNFGAVDIVIDENKQIKTLEINSGFSLEHYAATSATNRQQVVALYEHVIQAMFVKLE